MAKLGQAEMSSLIKNYTHNLITSTYDFMLVAVYCQLDMGEVMESELSKIKLTTFKRVMDRLQKNNLIADNADKMSGFEVTEKGKAKVEDILPQYREVRPWNGRIYTVVYDVPTNNNVLRNKLRLMLIDENCALFQNSVWVSGYEPYDFLNKFIEENQELQGNVLVTTLEENNEKNLITVKNVVENAFNLNSLADRYDNFVNFSDSDLPAGRQGFMSREETIFAYLSILKDDPQLPHEVLPQNWPGKKAKEIYSKITDSS